MKDETFKALEKFKIWIGAEGHEILYGLIESFIDFVNKEKKVDQQISTGAYIIIGNKREITVAKIIGIADTQELIKEGIIKMPGHTKAERRKKKKMKRR